MFWVVGIVLDIALRAWGIWAVISGNRRAQYCGSAEYWHGQSGISLTSTAYLVRVIGPSTHQPDEGHQLTATMLSLAIKKAIAVHPGSSSMYRGIDVGQAAPAGLNQMVVVGQGKRYATGITNIIMILPFTIDEASDAQRLGLNESEGALLNLLIAAS